MTRGTEQLLKPSPATSIRSAARPGHTDRRQLLVREELARRDDGAGRARRLTVERAAKPHNALQASPGRRSPGRAGAAPEHAPRGLQRAGGPASVPATRGEGPGGA